MEKWWEAGSLSGVPKASFSQHPFSWPSPDPGGRPPAWPGPGWPGSCLLPAHQYLRMLCFVCMPLDVVRRSPREIASCGRERDG